MRRPKDGVLEALKRADLRLGNVWGVLRPGDMTDTLLLLRNIEVPGLRSMEVPTLRVMLDMVPRVMLDMLPRTVLHDPVRIVEFRGVLGDDVPRREGGSKATLGKAETRVGRGRVEGILLLRGRVADTRAVRVDGVAKGDRHTSRDDFICRGVTGDGKIDDLICSSWDLVAMFSCEIEL